MQEMKSLNGFKLVDEEGRQLIRKAERRVDFNDKRLTNIERGYSDNFFTTDEEVAAAKTVPANAFPYAEVKQIYGSSSTVNGIRVANKPVRIEVCKPTKASTLNATLDLSEIDDTISVEKLADGSFKFNGTLSDGAQKFATVDLPTGTYGISYKIISNDNGVTPTLYSYTSMGHQQIDTDIVSEANVIGGGRADILIGVDTVAVDLIIMLEILEGTWQSGQFVGDLVPKSELVIPNEVVEMRGYGCGGNWIDLEAGVFHLAKEIVDGTIVSVEPVQDIDIRQYVGYDNLLAVEPNDVIRVIRADGTTGGHKTVITYRVKGVG